MVRAFSECLGHELPSGAGVASDDNEDLSLTMSDCASGVELHSETESVIEEDLERREAELAEERE